MRVSLILGLALTLFCFEAAIAQTNKVKFSNKLINLLTPFFTANELGKILDKMSADLYDELPIKNCSSKVMGYLAQECPPLKYGTLLSLMSKNDNCLKAANVKERTMDVLSQLGVILTDMLKKPYNQIITKVKNCKKNNITKAKCYEQMYKVSISCTTKDLIQKIVTKCANTMKCPIWKCSCENVNALMKVNDYNTTRTKKC